jgi:hypothetical protein
MIILYDYEGKSVEERERPIYTSVKDLNDQVIAKILSIKLEITIEEATEMARKGNRDNDDFWWSETKRYSIEIVD